MSNCQICAYVTYFAASVAILCAYSFFTSVILPAVLVGSLSSFKAKYNKSGKAWAVVTGTTSGIGAAFVSALAALGFNVLMIARNEAKLNEMKASLATHKVKIDYMVIDLAKPGAVSSELKKFMSTNEVTVLVNNAGLNTEYPKLLVDNSVAEIESILDVNCRSLSLLTHATLPAMLERKNGVIINISSLFGQLAGPLVAVYSGSKNFIDSFSASLSEELRGSGVHVFCSLPGFVVSNMSKIKRTSFTVISPETCVRNTLEQAAGGSFTTACPHWTHAAIGWFLTRIVPEWLRLRIIGNVNRGTNKAALRKLAKQEQTK